MGLFLTAWAQLPLSLDAQEYPMENTDNLEQVRSSAAVKFKDGNWEEARKISLEALRLAEGKWGPAHPSLVPFLDDLGAVDRQLGLYSDALKQYQWALAIQQKTLDPNDPAFAGSWDNLACLYDDLGRYAEAEISGQKAIQLDSAVADSGNLAMARRLGNLGRIELHIGKTQESEKAMDQALEIAEKKMGNSDSRLVHFLVGLAWACANNRHFPRGEELLQKALKLQIRNTVGTSVQVADSLKVLADYYWEATDKGKAKDYYGQALKIYMRLSPFGTSLDSLAHEESAAQCNCRLGNYQAAEDMLKKVSEALPRITGDFSTDLALCLAELSASQKALGQKENSGNNLQQSLAILRGSLGNDHPLYKSVAKTNE